MNPPNSKPDKFDVREGHASYAPAGIVTLEELVNLITAAISYARGEGIKKLLADARQLRGFDRPSLAKRYWIAREWAGAGAKVVEMALVLEPHLIDPDRFGVVVAWNSGLRADVFTEPAEALAWLLSGKEPSPLKAQ